MKYKKKISAITSLYKAENYLETFLNELSQQSCKSVLEVILVHNSPSQKEKEIIRAFQKSNPTRGLIKHIVVPKVEPLYKSWNRAISKASGEYIAIWNVDDLRTPRGLESQMNFLDDNLEHDAVHGNFVITRNFGDKKGQLIDHTHTLTNPEMLKSGMCIGPFFMFRKDIVEVIGYFDEQFKSGGDYDYALRMAHNGLKIGMVYGILGYYLDEQKGLSTRGDDVQPIERTVVEMRYDLYDKIDKKYVPGALADYDVKAIVSFGKRNDLKDYGLL